METSFLTGSENLYKYLVTMGTLLIVLTVYYPLREKQELEIKSTMLESEVRQLNHLIIENQNNVKKLAEIIKKKGRTHESIAYLNEIDKLNNINHRNQINIESKYLEIQIRRKYIGLYNYLFNILFPCGILLTIFGFIKWVSIKKVDDEILRLEKEKLDIEVRKLRD
jgi:predicted CDP-diglyceride synthetase/phosphatidate cytidylyltransferase